MSDTNGNSRLRAVRDELGLSREAVSRSPLLDPPITSKTLERWENNLTPVKGFRYLQLARIYKCKPSDLRESVAA